MEMFALQDRFWGRIKLGFKLQNYLLVDYLSVPSCYSKLVAFQFDFNGYRGERS